MQEIFQKYSSQELAIITIDTGEKSSVANNFSKGSNYTFPVLLDTNSEVAWRYNVSGLPITFFIDSSGKIVEMKLGAFSSMEDIESNLIKILH